MTEKFTGKDYLIMVVGAMVITSPLIYVAFFMG